MSSPRCPRCGSSLDPVSAGSTQGNCSACDSMMVAAGASEISLLTRSDSGEPRLESRLVLSPEFRTAYRLERVLGQGAMGTVFLALHLSTGQIRAVKVLTRPDKTTLARFFAEGKVLAGVSHPNVLKVYDVGEIGGHPYLATEYLEGGTLRQRLAGGHRLDLAEIVRVMTDCLNGLEACHERGIVHRDFKPENILFAAGGEARLADLGIARIRDAAQHLTCTGSLVGTPRYMSPEQARGEVATAASDIYAVGVVLYELLTRWSGGRPATILHGERAGLAEGRRRRTSCVHFGVDPGHRALGSSDR
ncbi:MAG: serine/threonine protein kinase [Candidatus Riflebacteria bacterium]|nr:serine/threonine protein kinase [Candidatus Riflebacteria bacterium]